MKKLLFILALALSTNAWALDKPSYQDACFDTSKGQPKTHDSFDGCNGKFIFTDGTYYGDWKNGLMDGFGKFYFKDGSKYVGKWRKGKMHGTGDLSVPEQSYYGGYFKKNKKHGFGSYSQIEQTNKDALSKDESNFDVLYLLGEWRNGSIKSSEVFLRENFSWKKIKEECLSIDDFLRSKGWSDKRAVQDFAERFFDEKGTRKKREEAKQQWLCIVGRCLMGLEEEALCR